MTTPSVPQLMPEQFQQRYQELQADLENLQKSIQDIAEVAMSEDRQVTVTVGARGELMDLKLDPRIYRNTDADALAEKIKETIWEANGAVTKRLVQLTQPLLPQGAGMDLEEQLRRVPLDRQA